MRNDDKRRDLNGRGWVKLSGEDLVTPQNMESASCFLRNTFATLPVDPYCTSNTRLRRFGQFDLDPVKRNLKPQQPKFEAVTAEYYSEYFQHKQVNPDDGGHGRKFPTFDLDFLGSSVVQDIVWRCHDLIEWDETLKRAVKIAGFHAVQYRPGDNNPAVGSPNVFHRDGEPYTFAILVERQGVQGGENYIGAVNVVNRRLDDVRQSDILDRFTLEDEFSGFGVCDSKVCHYVAPLTRSALSERGIRSVLLIDFTPATTLEHNASEFFS